MLDVAAGARERAIYPVDGALDDRRRPTVRRARMAVLEPGTRAIVTRRRARSLSCIGGAPLDGPRFIFWNFVSSSKERIERRSRTGEHSGWARFPGETEWIPLP